MSYATYLGGSGDEQVSAITSDLLGNAYVTGMTTSADFPLTSTAYGAASQDHPCAFVTKLNAAGVVAWSVCLRDAAGEAVAVDGGGYVYVLTNVAITKLSPAADRIVYTKAISGATAVRIAVDAAGNLYAAGGAGETFATTPGAYQQKLAPGMCTTSTFLLAQQMPCPDAFVEKLAPDGSVVYATYLGGSRPDVAFAIAVDTAGNAWVTGETASPNFPVTNGSKFGGEIDLGPVQYGDAFVAELDSTGSKLVFSTYLGGAAPDAGRAIAVDSAGAAYVAGVTQSADFPTTARAVQRVYGGGSTAPALAGDGFLAKFSATGTLVYATYLGGPQIESASAVAVDPQGLAYVNPFANTLTVVSADGSAIVNSLPAAGWFALDGLGGVYFGGSSLGYSFFPSAGAAQSKFGGGIYDATAVKFDLTAPESPWIGAIVNAAGMRTGTPSFYPVFDVAPGEIVTIFGSGFDGSTRVLFDGHVAKIAYWQDNQINATVPWTVAGPTTQITVQGWGQTFGPAVMNVFDAVPAVFTIDGSGKGQAAVLNQDGSVNSATNPAARGSVIAIFATGAGRMNPVPVLGVGCNLGSVTFAGQAPGLMDGAVQVNVQLSADGPAGDKVPLVVYIGNYASGFLGDTTVAVK